MLNYADIERACGGKSCPGRYILFGLGLVGFGVLCKKLLDLILRYRFIANIIVFPELLVKKLA